MTWSEERRRGYADTCILQRDMTWTIEPSEQLTAGGPVAEAISRFYQPFSRDLAHAAKHMRDVKKEGQPTDIDCPKCGTKMVVKWGRGGEFLACSSYPDCKSTSNFTRDDDGKITPVEQEVTDEV